MKFIDQLLSDTPITVTLHDLREIELEARAEAWEEGWSAGWSGTGENPYKDRK